MIDIRKPFGLAAAFLAIAAALHIVGVALASGGFIAPMIVGAIFWAGTVFALRLGIRWVAMLVFIATAFGGSVALGIGLSETGFLSIVFLGIAAVEWCATALLFRALWKNPIAVNNVT